MKTFFFESIYNTQEYALSELSNEPILVISYSQKKGKGTSNRTWLNADQALACSLAVKQEDIRLKGSSIECRINAEHPESFIPSPGKITQYHQPGGLGIRVDSAVYDGYSIPSHYDSMIGKLITYGATRSEALKKMNRALEEYVIMGINTNIQLHQKIIQTDEFKRGSYNINFMSNLIE